jgi:serine/threonine-protein kinase SRK2
MAESVIRPLFTKMCEAMKHFHKLGVAHRDIKMENILVKIDQITQEWIPKIIDFGLGTVFLKGETSKCIVGSVAFFSPEIA